MRLLSLARSSLPLTAAFFAIYSASGCSQIAMTSGPSSLKPDWIETQLFFGLTENGRRIPDDQWHDFVDRSITPRFPDGFTILDGSGQYRGGGGTIHKEPSEILIILHRNADLGRDEVALTEIAKEYVTRFHQGSVLRSDWAVQAAFISIDK
jgi:hypothetical protein